MNRKENFKNDLLNELRNDPEYAVEYLSAAKADSNQAFLVALRDVAEAQKGMKKVAKEAKLNRENLYRALSKAGNPRIDTLDAVLDVLGIEVKFVRKASVVSTTPGGAGPTGKAVGPSGRISVAAVTGQTSYTLNVPSSGEQSAKVINSLAAWHGMRTTAAPENLGELIASNTILSATTNAGNYLEE